MKKFKNRKFQETKDISKFEIKKGNPISRSVVIYHFHIYEHLTDLRMDNHHAKIRSASISENTTLGVDSTISLLPLSNITPSSSYANVFAKSVVRKNKRIQTDEQERSDSVTLENVQQILESMGSVKENIMELHELIKKNNEQATEHPSEPRPDNNPPESPQAENTSQLPATRPESSPSPSIQPTNIILIIGIVILLAINISIVVAVYNNNLTTTTTSLIQPTQSSKRCSVCGNHF